MGKKKKKHKNGFQVWFKNKHTGKNQYIGFAGKEEAEAFAQMVNGNVVCVST